MVVIPRESEYPVRRGLPVMAGLVPAIHVFITTHFDRVKSWMPGTSPGMTNLDGTPHRPTS